MVLTFEPTPRRVRITGRLLVPPRSRGLLQLEVRPGEVVRTGRLLRGSSSRLVLIDGVRLAALMIEHEVGVTLRPVKVPKLDSDYFES